jgi:NADPH:quinone reductase-like Zn-dependent oxidoreductase
MRETLNPDPAMVAVHHQAATEEVPHPEATAEEVLREVQAAQEGLVEDDVKLRSIQKT